jgi:hypothetical protein
MLVRRRQEKVMKSANRTNDIVAALFPKQVRDRLYEQAEAREKASRASRNGGFGLGNGNTSKMQMQRFLSNSGESEIFGPEPIADYFPHTTIMFLDVSSMQRLWYLHGRCFGSSHLTYFNAPQ